MKGFRYLSGLDWLIHALNRATWRHTGVGNRSQLVLELAGVIDAEVLREKLDEFASLFPMLAGCVRRRWTLEPYWKMPVKSAPRVRLELHDPNTDEVQQLLEACVNEPSTSGQEYVVLHLLRVSDDRSFLAMMFDHRLLDARGAELFLLQFIRFADGRLAAEEIRAGQELSVPSFLPGWKSKFESGREMMRSMRAIADQPITRLDGGGARGGGRFLLLSLTEAESQAFTARAFKEAGFLLFMPYALSVAASAFDRLCARRGRRGRYIVPCTTDLRGTDLSAARTFFNYSSMFFFKLDAEELSDRATLLESLKQQFFEQTKSGFPKHLQNVMALMRILPIPMFDWMICRHMQHCFGSFSFASVGKSLLEGERILGSEIVNLFHMPLVPPQTGIGFFFNQFGGRLNITVSHRDGLLDEADRAVVLSALHSKT